MIIELNLEQRQDMLFDIKILKHTVILKTMLKMQSLWIDNFKMLTFVFKKEPKKPTIVEAIRRK